MGDDLIYANVMGKIYDVFEPVEYSTTPPQYGKTHKWKIQKKIDFFKIA